MGQDNISTESLHQLLRKADWRFLLSNTSPDKSIIFGEGFLKDAVRLVSSSMVDGDCISNYEDLDCDLAVAIDPDVRILEKCYESLRPGGECYIELNCAPTCNLTSIRSKLKLVGFENTSFYIPKPNLSNIPVKIWVPLDKPSIINYSSSMYSKTNILRYDFVETIKYHIWKLNPKLFSNYPWFLTPQISNFSICSLSYKPDAEQTQSPIAKKFMANNNSETNSSILMLTEGQDIDNKTILFVFTDTCRDPSFIVKLLRTDEYSHLLRNEVKILRDLEENYPVLDGIPKILYSNSDSGTPTVGETFIAGTQISKLVSRKNYRVLAQKVTTWLANFARTTKTLEYHNKNIADSIFSDITASLSTALDNKLVQDTDDIISKLKLPYLIGEHRDFAPQNVLIDSKGKIGVIDWEHARLHGIPGLDLIFFLILLNFHLENAWGTGKFKEAYRNTLDPSTFAGSIFNECVNRYLNSLDISSDIARALRLTTLLAWLHIHLGDVISIGHPAKIRTSLFVSLWEEEIRDYRKTLI